MDWYRISINTLRSSGSNKSQQRKYTASHSNEARGSSRCIKNYTEYYMNAQLRISSSTHNTHRVTGRLHPSGPPPKTLFIHYPTTSFHLHFASEPLPSLYSAWFFSVHRVKYDRYTVRLRYSSVCDIVARSRRSSPYAV